MPNPYLSLVPDTPEAAPAEAAKPNRYADLLDAEDRARQQALQASLRAALPVNPDKAAAAAKIARDTGLPPALVERNSDALMEQQRMDEIRRAAAASPVLARQLSDPQFAKLAHDDTKPLSALEAIGSALVSSAKYVTSAPGTSSGLLADLAVGGYYRTAQASAALGRFGMDVLGAAADPLVGRVLPENPFKAGAESFAQMGRDREADIKRLSPPDPSIIGGGVSSGVQSFGQQAKYLPLLGMGPPGALLAGGMMALETGADAYQKARERGVSIMGSTLFAGSQGVVEYGTEKIPLGRLVQDLARNAPLRAVVWNQLKAEIPGEQVATLLQDMNEWAVLNPGKTAEQFLAERPSAAAQTLIATVVGVGANVALTRSLDQITFTDQDRQQRAQTALQQSQRLGMALEVAAQSRLRERDPASFQEFMTQAAQGGEVFIDAREAAAVLEQSQIPTEQLPAALREGLQEGLATGGDVRIPVGEYLTAVAGTPLAAGLQPHIRFDQNGMSQAEAEAEITGQSEAMNTAAERAVAAHEQRQAVRDSQAKVEQTIRDELAATGRFRSDVNGAYAKLISSFFTIQAARLQATRPDVTPESLFSEYRLGVRAQAAPGAATVLDQNPDLSQDILPDATEDSSLLPIPPTFGGMPTDGMLYHGGSLDGALEKQTGSVHGKPIFSYSRSPFEALEYAQHAGAGVHARPAQGARLYAGGDAALDAAYRAGDYTAIADAGYDGVDVRALSGGGYNEVVMWAAPTMSATADQLRDGYGLTSPFSGTVFEQRGVQPKGKPVPAELAGLANVEAAFAFAGSRAFPNNREFKVALQERLLAAAKKARVDITEFSAGTEDYLVAMGIADGMTALRTNANAVGWYNEKVTKALRLVSLIHPEIATDPQAKFAFVWAMAVTSNGLKVDKNFELAEAAYQQWKATGGTMPSNIGIGTAAGAINDSMALYNTLIQQHGFEAVEKFMTTLQPAGEVEKFTGQKVSGENKTTTVYGAAALGPKIGNGFFMNLYGRFEQLTMDRWLMRTWGRWTGTLVESNPAQVKAKRTLVKDIVRAMSKEDKKAFEVIIGRPLALGDPDAVAKAITKASTSKAARDLMAQVGVAEQEAIDAVVGDAKKGQARISLGDELRKAGNALTKYLDGQKEAPSGAPERGNIRKVFSRVLAELQKSHPALTMSDYQALLWYPEKRLYDAAKTSDEASTGYEDDEAPDYANAAAKLARSRGVPDADIVAAVAAVDAELSAAVGAGGVRPGAGGSAAGGTDARRADGQRLTLDQSAFHGSPYAGIEKFDTQFIGAGEGAAAYGWGLYFASLKDVAETYRQALSAGERATIDGREIDRSNPAEVAAYELARVGGDRPAAVEQLGNLINAPVFTAQAKAVWRESLAMIERGDALPAIQFDAGKGQVYEVDVPEDGELLLWDKPLMDQPGKFLDAMRSASSGGWVNRGGMRQYLEPPTATMTGADAYLRLSRLLGSDRAASEALLAAGVKGIKYLDGNSRNAGRGTYNFVIFSGDDVAIRQSFYQDRSLPIKDGQDTDFVSGQAVRVQVFHGSDREITAFDPTKLGENTGAPSARMGFFFAGTEATSSRYMRANLDGVTVTPAAAAEMDRKQLGDLMAQWDAESMSDGWLFDVIDMLAETAGAKTVAGDTLDQKRSGLRKWVAEAPTDLVSTVVNWINESDYGVLTTSPGEADGGAGNGGVMNRATVTMRNPFVYDYEGADYREVSYALVIEQAKALGHDGVILMNTKDPGPAPDNIFVVFDSENVETTGADYWQSDSTPRGQIAFGQDITKTPSIITLFQGADLSTFLHEAGHFFLQVQFDLASRADTPQDIKDDAATLLAWFGIKDTPEASAITQWFAMPLEEQRQYHERFARGFEARLMSGESPSIELAGIFSRFRAWLQQVYQSLKDLKVTLTPEVRQVMDRMVASTDEILAAEQARSMMPLFTEQGGPLPAADWEAYNAAANEQVQQAQAKLDERMIREMRLLHTARSRVLKRLQAQAEEQRREVRMEARAEVLQDPVYRAWQLLTKKIRPEDRIKADKRKSDPNIVDPEVDSLFVAIAKLGGLRRDEVVTRWGVDAKGRAPSPVFGKPVWRATEGRSMDEMAEALMDLGYLAADENGKADVRDLEDRFSAEERGDLQYAAQHDYSALGEPVAGEHVDLSAVESARLSVGALVQAGLPQEIIDHLINLGMAVRGEQGVDHNLIASVMLLADGAPAFSDGEDMVRRLAAAPPPKEAIEQATDRIMLERYGDLATPAALERATDEALHNEARERVMAIEAAAFEEATDVREEAGATKGGRLKTVSSLTRQARMLAASLVGRVKIRDLRPGQYVTAAARAGRLSEAQRGKDLKVAAAEKRNQLLQSAMAREAFTGLAEYEKAIRYLKKFDSAGVRKSIDADYLDQIDQLLERIEVRQVSAKKVEGRKSLLAWIEKQEELGLDPVVDQRLIDQAQLTNLRDMTVEEMRGLLDTIKSIEHLGRLKTKLLTARDGREFAAVAQEIRESIEANSNRRVQPRLSSNTWPSKVGDVARGFVAMHRKFASMAFEMDGGKDGGVVWERFIRGMNAAGDREAQLRADATEALVSTFEGLRGVKLTQKINVPGLGTMTREHIISMALNWGNAGNRQRLLDGGVIGTPITNDQVQAAFANLSEREWDFVQKVWDTIEQFRPMISEQEKRLTGVEPQWVEPSPFVLSSGRAMRGGYYPAKYDGRLSTRSNELEAVTDLKQAMKGASGRAATRNGYTKERATEVKGRPLRLDLGVLTQHVNEVTHRLAWQDWLIDTRRLLADGGVEAAIRENYGPDILDEMKKQLADIAQGDIPASDSFDRILSHLRSGVTVVGLGWNIATSLLQFTGYAQSIVRVGFKGMGIGLREFASDPRKKTAWVMERSTFMRNRATTMSREINDLIGDLRNEKLNKVEATYFWTIQKMQTLVDMPTWLGAYELAVADGQDEDRAVALADQAVRDSQGGGQLQDLARIQRGGPTRKLFTAFYGFFNVTYNLAVERGRITRAKDAGAMAKLASDMVLLFVVPSMAATLLKSVLKGDDDDPEKLMRKLLADQFSYLTGTMIGMREVGGMVANSFGSGTPAGLRWMEEMGKMFRQVGQGEMDAALLKSVNNVAGIVFHYPAAALQRLVEGLVAVADGRAGPGALLFGPPKE